MQPWDHVPPDPKAPSSFFRCRSPNRPAAVSLFSVPVASSLAGVSLFLGARTMPPCRPIFCRCRSPNSPAAVASFSVPVIRQPCCCFLFLGASHQTAPPLCLHLSSVPATGQPSRCIFCSRCQSPDSPAAVSFLLGARRRMIYPRNVLFFRLALCKLARSLLQLGLFHLALTLLTTPLTLVNRLHSDHSPTATASPVVNKSAISNIPQLHFFPVRVEPADYGRRHKGYESRSSQYNVGGSLYGTLPLHRGLGPLRCRHVSEHLRDYPDTVLVEAIRDHGLRLGYIGSSIRA